EPRQFQRTADSGRVNVRLVCPECGSWICGMPRDGVVRVRGGTLDDISWLRPTRHIWTRRKQPWVELPEGDAVFEGQPAGWDGTVRNRALRGVWGGQGGRVLGGHGLSDRLSPRDHSRPAAGPALG